jgi:hypothetical protein
MRKKLDQLDLLFLREALCLLFNNVDPGSRHKTILAPKPVIARRLSDHRTGRPLTQAVLTRTRSLSLAVLAWISSAALRECFVDTFARPVAHARGSDREPSISGPFSFADLSPSLREPLLTCGLLTRGWPPADAGGSDKSLPPADAGGSDKSLDAGVGSLRLFRNAGSELGNYHIRKCRYWPKSARQRSAVWRRSY